MKEFGLAFAPLAPLWLVAVFAALAAVVVAAAFFLRRRGAVLRALLFLVLLGALVNPSLVEEKREPLRDVVAVVLDHSASQDFGDRRAQTEAAREPTWQGLEEAEHVDVRFIDAGGEAERPRRATAQNCLRRSTPALPMSRPQGSARSSW